jgi:hypothetical protein
LSKYGQDTINNPEGNLKGVRDQLYGSVNDNFAGAGDAIQKQFAQRGMVKSGKVASRIAGSELQRFRALAGADTAYGNMQRDERSRGVNVLQQLLGQDMESEGFGSQTQPGNVAGGAVSGGLGALFRLIGGGMFNGAGGGGGPIPGDSYDFEGMN